MGADRTLFAAQGEAISLSGTQAPGQPQSADRHPLCLEDWHYVGRSTTGTGLRLWDELLASAARVATRWAVANPPAVVARQAARRTEDRLVTGGDGQPKQTNCRRAPTMTIPPWAGPQP